MGWEDVAAEQSGLITREQATNSGLTAKQIERLVISGKWERCHPSVYRRTDVPVAWPSTLQAALLWAGDDAVISHESAAAFWGCTEMNTSVVHLAGTRALSAPRGIQYTRVSKLEDWDKTFCEGLPITPPARTLLDTSGTISNFRFERALDQLLSWNVTCTRDCELMVERHSSKGRPGAAFMKMLVANRKRYGLLRSPLESDFEGYRRAWGLPEAEHNHDLFIDDRFIANIDFAWPAQRVLVETHGKDVHLQEKVWRRDIGVGNDLQGTGWQLFVVTWKDLKEAPEKVRAKLVRALTPTRPTSSAPALSP
jgi:hypothetical protein